MSIKSKIQSVLMPKDMDQSERDDWLESHGFKKAFNNKHAHETDNYFRYRQFNPRQHDHEEYRTVIIDGDKGVKAIIEYDAPKYKKKRQKKQQQQLASSEVQ